MFVIVRHTPSHPVIVTGVFGPYVGEHLARADVDRLYRAHPEFVYVVRPVVHMSYGASDHAGFVSF